MKRRIFAGFWLLGLALPLVAGSSRAQQAKPAAAAAAPAPAPLNAQQIVSNVERFTIRSRPSDVQGNRNRLDFDNPSVNAKAPPGAFVFTPPPGTQVIQPSGAQTVPTSGAQVPSP